MRTLLLLLCSLTILFASCQPKVVGKGPWVQKIDSEELSKIVINFSTKMKIDKHLELEDSWATYDDYITKMYLKYSSQRLLTVYDARLLVVELVEELLTRLNNNEIISYELSDFPFTADNLDVQIIFESFHGLYVDPLYVGCIWLKNGCTHFYAFDSKNPTLIKNDWKDHRSEPYSKSRMLALLKKEADLPYIQSEPKNYDLFEETDFKKIDF
jgi:hypothetical protein